MDTIEITLNSCDIQWFKNKGYLIPTEKVQLWAKNAQGERIKNGMGERVRQGTKLVVRVDDLRPTSNRKVEWTCNNCNQTHKTTYYAFLRKKSTLCRKCYNTTQRNLDSQDYWVDQLIKKNEGAKCAISGETDKRFLVLHHLRSRSSGGENEESNYVVLTANWHLAFHRWMGGHNIPCREEDFYEFKQLQVLEDAGD